MILSKKEKMEITFILPTINRKKYVIRAIKSCLNINQKNPNVIAKVLVIDGQSDDGAWELMLDKFKNHKNVKLLQVDKNLGFQESAFFGLKYVKSEYCTYMYNDDIVSNFYSTFASNLIKSSQTFIMGYGKNNDVSKIYKFFDPSFVKIKTNNLILNYFGFFNYLKFTSLPVSPVPSVSKTSNLKKWEVEVRNFVKNSKFKEELMLKKNIGPDLILYLYNLMIQKEEIVFCNTSIAQLSYHKSSMSIIYGKAPLSTGYWLARIWYFESLLKSNKINKNYISKLSAYLIVSGLFIFILNTISLNFFYAKNTLYETLKVVLKIQNKKCFLKTIYYSIFIVINRLKRKKKLYTPN